MVNQKQVLAEIAHLQSADSPELPVAVIELCAQAGLDVYETAELPDDWDAEIVEEGERTILLVRELLTPEEKRELIAVQLAEWLREEDATDEELDTLAREILLPKASFVAIWRAHKDIHVVAQHFGVSENLCVQRAGDLLLLEVVVDKQARRLSDAELEAALQRQKLEAQLSLSVAMQRVALAVIYLLPLVFLGLLSVLVIAAVSTGNLELVQTLLLSLVSAGGGYLTAYLQQRV